MKKIIIVSLILLGSIANAQGVIPGKLRYYSNQDVAQATRTPGSVAKDVNLYKYENSAIVGNDVKLYKYDNESLTKSIGNSQNVKLYKYDNDSLAKSIGNSKNVILKNYDTNFDVPVIGRQKINTNETSGTSTQPIQNFNNNNLAFDGKNQNSTGKITPIK